MKKVLVILGILLFVLHLEADQIATGTVSELDGRFYKSDIYPRQLEKAPKWDPIQQPQPPLAPGKAIDLAQLKIELLFPKYKDWQVQQVTLSWSYLPDHWYYRVLVGRKNSRVGNVPSFGILVLMDGTVIEPIAMK